MKSSIGNCKSAGKKNDRKKEKKSRETKLMTTERGRKKQYTFNFNCHTKMSF